MGERVKHLDPEVAIEGTTDGRGVVMKTTETTIREEAFIDPQQIVDSTKRRELKALLKAGGGLLLTVAALSFAFSSIDQFNKDSGNKDRKGQERDGAEVLLGFGAAYESGRYAMRKLRETERADRQEDTAKEYSIIISSESRSTK